MRNTPIALVLVAVAICAAASCQKIPEPAHLGLSAADFTSSIPLEYGELVSVTPLPETPHTVMLWFKRPDQSIVAIRVNVSRGTLFNLVLEIPRS